MWSDLAAFQRSLRRVLAWDFERIAADHNDRVHDSAIKDRIRTVLEWTAALEPGRHRTMLGRFFWHQPRFLYDMIRYKLHTLQAAHPGLTMAVAVSVALACHRGP